MAGLVEDAVGGLEGSIRPRGSSSLVTTTVLDCESDEDRHDPLAADTAVACRAVAERSGVDSEADAVARRSSAASMARCNSDSDSVLLSYMATSGITPIDI